MNIKHIYQIQALFVIGMALGAGILSFEEKLQWLNICRYVIYIVTIHAITQACILAVDYQAGRLPNLEKIVEEARSYLVIFTSCTALLLYHEQTLFREEFVYLFLAFLIYKYPEMTAKQTINYGVGMACSFFEGYLVHIIPSDGANFVGFEENIRALEDSEGVLFPVKKLFIIITKTLFCPPDLKHFNKDNDVPHLEAFNSFQDVVKSVAGVKNRTYRNTAYKIYRPSRGTDVALPPVCLAAECATPLHTLHRVLGNTALYQQLANIDTARVVEDFCSTLRTIIERSPLTKGKCELVYYDDEDPSQNLAEILLARIREIDANFEQKILDRRNDNVLDQD